MSTPLFVVDAFSAVPFRGNPAAVCLLDNPMSEAWMQQVAAEMNLSETAFLLPLREGGWSLRWFTPRLEVDLCGHATLACAHVLWQPGKLEADEEAVFETRSGELRATRDGEWIALDFPRIEPEPCHVPEDVFERALGVRVRGCWRAGTDYLVEIGDRDELVGLMPEMSLLGRIECRGVIVTCRAADAGRWDFLSRFFAPNAGIAEDPVTGSAHCALGPFWAARLGKTNLSAQQLSPRGGELGVDVYPDRVVLKGQAVTVSSGVLVGKTD